MPGERYRASYSATTDGTKAGKPPASKHTICREERIISPSLAYGDKRVMRRSPLTVKGAQALRSELEHLKSVVRPRIIAAIAEARAHGDLKENAEYHAAREQQSFSEGRINELENTLASAEVIDVSKLNPGSRIVFGALVELMELHSEQTVRYQIVGDLEADFKQRKISVSSPVGRALIGKHEGDTVDIQTPSGIKSYEIMGVEYEA